MRPASPSDDWFTHDGPLAQAVDGFAPREAQRVMAQHIEQTLEQKSQLIVEAPTGTGKTLAYLLPVINSGYKTIIATATRHLQDQIFSKDLPMALAATGRRAKVSLLKGRANYLCLHRLDTAETEGGRLDARFYGQLRELRRWAARTRTGDISEVGDPNEPSMLWPRVTSTAENCLGSDCPAYDDCWVLAARREAQAADIVVANHHLFFADVALREEGFGEVLPGADAIVLDEAHKLPDLAGRFFGQSVSGRQIKDLLRDGKAEAETAGGDMPALDEALASLDAAERQLDRVLPAEGGHYGWEQLVRQPGFDDCLDACQRAVALLAQEFKSLSERSEGLASVARRSAELVLRHELLQTESADSVRWLERRGAGWLLHITPLDAAGPFARAVAGQPRAWILTSATLSVDNKLNYFASRLGLEQAGHLILDSPFDYANNSLVYLPTGLPLPNAPDFDDQALSACEPLIEASNGGVFILCTSHRAVARWERCLRARNRYQLLVQGQAGRGALLAEFREHGNAVLIGTSSFWEGVDVRGPALRLVIIDRLPFASPADPVLGARLQAMKNEGQAPFTALQLPQAVITFKQGAGRLIRDARDRGLLCVCDPRVTSKGYGRSFLQSLPPMPVTRSLAEAQAFLQRIRPE